MTPTVEKLPEPPNVAFWWDRSANGKKHCIYAFVDSWQLDVPYAVCWIEGQELAFAIETQRLPDGTAPGWYVQDDCGDVLDEPLTPEAGKPLDVLLWREIVAKLKKVRQSLGQS